MEKSESKLNKQLSKYYVEHACQISSTGTVAAELGLEPSRISELRGGRRQLTASQAEKIKEIYGLPSASNGHWMECELLLSTNLNKQFIDNGLVLHYLQIMKAIKSEDFFNPIMDCFYFSDPSVPGYRSMAGLDREAYIEAQKENDNIFLKYKLKYFNELLANDSFQTYCDSNIKEIAPEFLNNLCEVINPNFNFHFNINFKAHFLKLIRDIRKVRELVLLNTYAHLGTFNEGFSVGGRCQINNIASPKKEYVVVGKVVWELGQEYRLRLTMPIANKGVCGFQADDDCLNFSRSLYPKVFTHCSIKLYYSELYKYFLQLDLHENEAGFEPSRKVLVEIADRQNIFDELVDIFDYFQIETGWTLKQIKYAIAQNGGHIPGAIYLD